MFKCFVDFSRFCTGLLIYLIVVSGCTAVRPVLEYNDDATIKSLSTNLNISVVKADMGFSGNGVLAYRRPDQLHLVMLSPFGTTILEIFSENDQITVIYPNESTAYVGKYTDLPKGGFLKAWRVLQWVLDAAPSSMKGFNGIKHIVHPSGSSEQITFKDGLVVSKKTSTGEEVYYYDYTLFSGIPLAAKIDLHFKDDERIRLFLDDSEINTHIEDRVFIPKLQGIRVLPLSLVPDI